MPTTNFLPGTTITSDWLNEVDQVVHDSDGANYVNFTPAGTGAVSRTVQGKLREPYVTPDDKGAAGDGVTDDNTAFANALVDGRDVYLPFGKTYLIGAQTVSTVGQRIFGRGGVKLKNNTNQSVFTISADGVRFEGITIDGNKANQTVAGPAPTNNDLGAGIWLADGVDYFEARGLYIHDTERDSIGGYGNHIGVNIIGNRLETPGFCCVDPSQGSTRPAERWVIADNVMISPGQDGIGTVAMQHCSIHGNTIYQPTVAGIALEARCDNTTCMGNTVVGIGSGDTANGIQVNDSVDVTVSGNTLTSLGVGITVSGDNTSKNVTVTGNTLYDCGYNSNGAISLSSTVAGGFLNNYRYGIVCSGNTLRNSWRTGIFINQVAGVICENNTIRNINLDDDQTTNRFMAGICLRTSAHDCIVAGNAIHDDTGGNWRVGILEVGDSSLTPARNTYRDNEITGFNQDILAQYNNASASEVVRRRRGTSTPTTDTWHRGQVQLHAHPAAAGAIGWVQTDQLGGSFGTLAATTGTINAGQATLTLSQTEALHDGMSITVAGAGAAGVPLLTAIVTINRTTKVATLVGNAGTSVVDAAVTLTTPTFKTFGAITA